MERCDDLNLRLGLPGRDESEQQPSSSSSSSSSLSFLNTNTNTNTNNKRSSSQMEKTDQVQLIGWPPVRSYPKKALQRRSEPEVTTEMLVKVSMDGAPYLRKIDLKLYKTYSDLLKALEAMFNCTIGVYSEREGYNGSELAPTYEDKDGDWMLVGDVPMEMFLSSCKRLRIIKSSDAKVLQNLL